MSSSQSPRCHSPCLESELPGPLLSDVPGTWAYDTMSRRIREEILNRIIRDNAAELTLRPAAAEAIKGLDAELRNASETCLTYLNGPGAGPADVHVWNTQILKPWVESQETWLSSPWMVTEFYFYRRVAEAFGWCKPGGQKEQIDPFRDQKMLGVTSALSAMEVVSARLNSSCDGAPAAETGLRTWILASLWGNKMDLSIWPVGEGGTDQADDTFQVIMSAGTQQLLANDLGDVAEDLLLKRGDDPSSTNIARIDIVIDNAGFELFCDLCLADYLVSARVTNTVHIHLKAHPTFVSDALDADLLYLIDTLSSSSSTHPQAAVASPRWRSHIASGAWVLRDNLFWVQGSPLWSMPDDLYADIAAHSTAAFLKGDANYRRLLGDLSWDLSATPYGQLARCFPTSLCALRILKAEVGCGMDEAEVARAREADKEFLVSGKWGVVQYYKR